jgi:hypothetical protein
MDKFVNHKELKIFGEVWLHGSRKMNQRQFPWDRKKLPEGTDWDYAAQHKQPWQQTDQMVKSEGWVEVVDKSYMDNDTAFVYEKVIDGEKVQVSLRQDLARYKAVFTSVDPDFYFLYLWKGSDNCLDVNYRRAFWNQMYWSYEAGANSSWEGGVPF